MSSDDNLYTQLKNKFLNNKLIAYAGIIMVAILFLINFCEKVSGFFNKDDTHIETPTSSQDQSATTIQIEQTYNQHESSSNHITNDEVHINNPPAQQPSQKVPAKQKKKLCFSLNLLELISESDFEASLINKLGYVPLSESPCVRISLDHTGEIIRVNDTQLYQYLGGEVRITIDGKECQILPDAILPSSLPEGNPKSYLEKRILADLKSIAKDNKEDVILAIKNCLHKSY